MRHVQPLPDSASFLANLLLHFGVFSSATLDPRTGSLRLVLLTRSVSRPAYAGFRRRLADAIAVLHELERRPPPRLCIRRDGSARITRIEITRSLEDLTYEELALISQLSRDLLPLVVQGEGLAAEEDQEERLRASLEQVRELRGARRYVGLREGGHVLIYVAPDAGRRARGE